MSGFLLNTRADQRDGLAIRPPANRRGFPARFFRVRGDQEPGHPCGAPGAETVTATRRKAVRAAKGTTQVIWLAVASLAGVGLLVWLGSMFLPGDDATETDTAVPEAADVIVFDETDMAEADEEATVVVDRGTWLMVEDRDPMDDSPHVIGVLEEDGATLMAGCASTSSGG